MPHGDRVVALVHGMVFPGNTTNSVCHHWVIKSFCDIWIFLLLVSCSFFF